MSSSGTKVTSDPESQRNPKTENPGIVTSDSLAAESIEQGGSFAATSDARGPHAQPSSSTNTNNTDTSNATVLAPAPDAEARQAQQDWSESAALNAGSSLGGKSDGQGPTYNTAAGGSSGGSSGGVTSSSGNVGGASSAGTAPAYYDHTAPSVGDNFQPKGENLTEGGFDENAPNASYTTDIGGKNDPGRVALQRADVPVAGGAGARQTEITADGQFDVLKETSA